MNRKHIVAAVIVCVVLSVFTVPAWSSDYGCKVLLCLSNPGGATEFVECQADIHRLEAELAIGKPMPPCNMSDSGGGEAGAVPGVDVSQGYQPMLTCEQSWGPEYEQHTEKRDGGKTTHTYCRQQTGTRERKMFEWGSGMDVDKMVPVYDIKPVQVNAKPFFVQVTNNGVEGQKFYYKVEAKDEDDGGWF